MLLNNRSKYGIISLVVLFLLITLPVQAATYTYDNLNRLTKAEYDNGQVITYSYDAAGNMTTVTTTGAKSVDASAIDNHISMSADNTTVDINDNTWSIDITNAAVKDIVSSEDLAINNLPAGLSVVAAKGTGNTIVITVSGSLAEPIAEPLNLSIIVKARAFVESDLGDSAPVDVVINQYEQLQIINTTVSMDSGNQTVSDTANSWILKINGITLKDNLTNEDVVITGLPDGLNTTISKQGNDNIVITVGGTASAPIETPTLVNIQIKASAFDDVNASDLNPVSLTIVPMPDCFIATAAFGSYLDPHVFALRKFRDNVLANSQAGRWFIANYYHYSPPLAAYISNHDTVRVISRILLTPVVFAVQYPSFIPVVLILISGIGVLLISRKRSQSIKSLR